MFTHGVARTDVAIDDEDYERGLRLLAEFASQFELQVHAWAYLPNHTHLLLTSPLGNLSEAMRWHGTCAAQSFNRRYGRAGHLTKGRFGSRLIDDDNWFLELVRYVVLNPVRAGLCRSPGAWRWSSFAATAGLEPAPPYLFADDILAAFGTRARYVDWVVGGIGSTAVDADGVLRRPPLSAVLVDGSVAAMASAHHEHGYSMTEIAEHLGTSRASVSRRLHAWRQTPDAHGT